jgi:hypothetical protein
MRVGFVRKAGLGAMILAVAALAACDDDPLEFDPQDTSSLYVNPSAMTLPGGGSQNLVARAQNQGREPTFAEVLVNGTQVLEDAPVDVGCAIVSLDPDALPIQPPGLFVVTGKSQLTTCSFTLSSSGAPDVTVPIAITAGGIELTLVSPEPPVRAGDSGSFEAVLIGGDGNPVSPFDQTEDCTWSSDDTDVMVVDSTGAFTTPGTAGPVTVTCAWESTVPGVPGDTIPQDIEREGTFVISVIADFPTTAEFAAGADLGVVEVGATSNFGVNVFDQYGNLNNLPSDILGVSASSGDAGIATATASVRLDTVPDTDPPLVFATPVVEVTGVAVGNTTISGTVETVSGDLPFSATVAVLGAPPELTGLSAVSGVPGDLVVINGTGFEPVMEVFIDGASIGGAGSISVEEITATSVSFYWPITDDGEHAVTVGVFPLFSNPLTFAQTDRLEADEPENDDDATTETQITIGEGWVGAFGTGEYDDYIAVNIPAAGTYDFVLDWDVAGQDLDLVLYDDTQTALCTSYFSKPEADCVGQELAAGTYYVLVEDYDAATGSPTDVNYRLSTE